MAPVRSYLPTLVLIVGVDLTAVGFGHDGLGSWVAALLGGALLAIFAGWCTRD